MPTKKSPNVAEAQAVLKVLWVGSQPEGTSGLTSALKKASSAEIQLSTVDPAHAAASLKKAGFDLILLNDSPPQCDALDLLPGVRKAKVVVLTAHEDWKRVMELLTAGASEVVTPQQSASGMLAFTLRRVLGRSSRGAQKSAEPPAAQHRTDEAVHERYKHLRLALRNSPVSVWLQDRDLRYTWVYNPAPPITNLREIVGKTDEEILGAEAAGPLVDLKRKVLTEGERIEQDVSITLHGATTHYSLSVEPVRDEEGKITGIVCASVDISRMHRTDEALQRVNDELREANQRLERDMRQRQSISSALRKQAELLDLAQDAILVCDLEDRILYWNHGAEETYGWKSNEAVGMIAYELLLTNFPESFENIKAALLRDGSYAAELEHTTREGKRIIVASRWVARKNGGGVSFLQINRDITERKHINEALRESEERFRAIFAESSIGILLEDPRGQILDANPAVQKMLGWTPDELRRLGVAGITHPDDSESSLKLLAAMETGARGRQSVEKRYVRKNGGPIWGSVTLFGVRDARGKLRFITAMIEDISLRKQAEERLLEAAEQRRLALEAASLGTWDYNLQTGDVLWDERCRLLFGVPDADALKYEQVLSLIHAEDRAMVDRTLVEAVNPSSDGRYEIEFRTVWPWDDTVHWLSAKGQAYFEGSGKRWHAVRLVGTFMDVGARKAAEEQIRLHADHLEQLVAERTAQIEKLERQRLESEKQVAVGRMAARIAHEINNPLAGVGMSFRLVKKAVPVDHPNYQYTERIETELDRIARIVRQMFELYRPSPHEPDVFNPAEAVRDVISLLESTLRAQELHLEVDTQEAEQIVTMHRDSLKQVLFNLLQNAIEASPKGSTVYIRAHVNGNNLLLTVADQGAGIPEEAKPHVFEPFFTTKDYLTTGGLGLGLSITRSLVEALGGTVEFESNINGGTVFHATLPVTGLAATQP
ncbi:MAG TPA: PAS domain S-box protein [bacterium]